MTIWVTELRGNANATNLPSIYGSAPVTALAISGSSVSTGLLTRSDTNLILVSGDTGAWILAGSSGSTVNASSTNGIRIPAGAAPMQFAVNPFARITAVST